MHAFLASSWQIGSVTLPHRLIQGPLAGYSCAPFRTMFSQYHAPAYCVTEMSSARDVLHKYPLSSRYLYRAPQEQVLAYQISGVDPDILAQAAQKLQHLGADLIDINCGCPKPKIRKKGAGSALLEQPFLLKKVVDTVRRSISIPLSVKIRLQNNEQDFLIAQIIQDAGADALIIHGRRWTENYTDSVNFTQIAAIKKILTIPVIANGDIKDYHTLEHAVLQSECDAFMISRAGTGTPWLYASLLNQPAFIPSIEERMDLFIRHVIGLARLENEVKALLQSRSLIRYYFRELSSQQLQQHHTHVDLKEMILWCEKLNDGIGLID